MNNWKFNKNTARLFWQPIVSIRGKGLFLDLSFSNKNINIVKKWTLVRDQFANIVFAHITLKNPFLPISPKISTSQGKCITLKVAFFAHISLENLVYYCILFYYTTLLLVSLMHLSRILQVKAYLTGVICTKIRKLLRTNIALFATLHSLLICKKFWLWPFLCPKHEILEWKNN